MKRRLKRYIRYGRTLWRLSAAQWGMLIGTTIMTAGVRGALSVYSLREVVKGLQRLAQRFPSQRPLTPSHRREVAWIASRVGARLLPKRPCLTQALVTQFFLWRRGDDTTSMHIGVTKGEDGGLLAHAWVEHEGQVIIGGTGSPERYKRLEQLEERIHAGPTSRGA